MSGKAKTACTPALLGHASPLSIGLGKGHAVDITPEPNNERGWLHGVCVGSW